MQPFHDKVRETNRKGRPARWVVILCLLSINAWSQDKAKSWLEVIGDGKVWVSPEAKQRIHFSGSDTQGYDVAFETKNKEKWFAVAGFPAGMVWEVYDQWGTGHWGPQWYAGEHGFKISQIHAGAGGESVECTSQGEVGGQRWEFADRYSFEYGAVKVVRRWHHASPQSQSPITLVTAVRLDTGSDARWMLPAIIYDDNPGTYPTRQVPHLPKVAFAKGVYEEHRFPVPFVNVESTVASERTYASLLSVPSKVPQGHKGNDQWWSLGLQWLWGDKVDLLLVSGAVTTNGMNSMVYGHINHFDPYGDAYIDVAGEVTFEKTFYIDTGIAARTGYAFRETLWKAFQVFQPVKTGSIPFTEAKDLKLKFAAQAYLEEPDGTAGIPLVPIVPGINPTLPRAFGRFTYGWVGRDLATAFALLKEADRTGNENYRRIALKTVRFYTEHVRRDTPGLLYGDFSLPEKKWVGFIGLPEWPESISSRQLGEILDHLVDLTTWAQEKQLPDAGRWQALLVEAANFLVAARRYEGLYPRNWYPDGRPVGWGEDGPATGTVTASGAYLVAPLAKLYRLTGDQRYLDTAESVLRAYYDAYGRDLKQSYAGATLDAACEDKEAGQGVLHGAMALFEVTKKPEYLQWARDAADWVLTWCYMYNVDFSTGTPAYGLVNSVGWTTVSVQNEVVDMFGNYTAPDMYMLGNYLHDPRYQEMAKTIFAASTQTIARPGAMFGLPNPGMQYEHVNQTNYTHIAAGHWRGDLHTPDIAWPLANSLYIGEKMAEIGAIKW